MEQWGDIQWQSMETAFTGCSNLVINATDAPDLTQVTSLYGMFAVCDSFNQSINHWDVSNVTNMAGLFSSADTYNQPLDNWDVSNVTDMKYMFSEAADFNQNINNWNVSNVTDMSFMFQFSNDYNQPLDQWDVSNVLYYNAMFLKATSFNQDISTWNFNSNLNHLAEFLDDSGMDVQNYDQLLMHFYTSNMSGIVLGADGLLYCNSSVERAELINNLGWTILGDDIQDPSCDFVSTKNPIANQIVIYPNPTQSVLNIETRNNQQIQEIKIYNLNGLELQNLKGNQQQLNLERLSSGVYFIEITTAEGVVTKRVLKD